MGWSLGVVWGPCPLLPTFCFIDHLRYWGGGGSELQRRDRKLFPGVVGLCVAGDSSPQSCVV